MRLMRFTILALPLLAGACNFAPDYQAPDTPAPAAYKEDADWKRAAPADSLPRGPWWGIYGNTRLDRLEGELIEANQTLKLALANHEQAEAAARYAGSSQYPEIDLGASAQRKQSSRRTALVTHPNLYNDISVAPSLSWEIDLWGRLRNLVSGAERRAEAGAADLAAAQLALSSQLAQAYFTLQGLDSRQDLLERTVKDDEEAQAFTRRLHEGGAAAQVDVDQAEAQLSTARTQATHNRLLRSQQEHAIAILVGMAPAEFALDPETPAANPPVVEAGLPSALLERRPDIAAAERRVQAANTDIGVARAAYFPTFDLAALGGVEAAKTGNLFTSPAAIWAVGPRAAGTLFDAGRNFAATDQAIAVFHGAAAAYRQTVLVAYREVEDSLAALRRLEEESRTQATAASAAERALQQAEIRYKGGLATYLEVISAQNAALVAESSVIDIRTRRMQSSVLLIQALGGGWEGLPKMAAD